MGRTVTRRPRPLHQLSRLGRPGAALAQEAADLGLLGPRTWWEQRRPGGGIDRDRRTAWYRDTWRRAAAELGYAVTDGPGSALTIRNGGTSIRALAHLLSVDDPVTLRLAGDKPTTHALLREAGLPVPEHVVVSPAAPDEGVPFLARHRRVVVKPATGSGAGDGVTGGVTTARDLRRAVLRAARQDAHQVLLEPHVTAEEVRVLVVEGDPVAVVVRRPPVVVGDGRSSVTDLVRDENRRRAGVAALAGVHPLRIDLDAVLALASQDLRPGTSPARGRRVRLGHRTSLGSERDASPIAVADPHVAGVVADAAVAARTLGSRLASVEVLTPDPAVATADAGGVVLEVNTTPGIAQHYAVDSPDAVPDTAMLVLERLLG